jgi:hypothetical protein
MFQPVIITAGRTISIVNVNIINSNIDQPFTQKVKVKSGHSYKYPGHPHVQGQETNILPKAFRNIEVDIPEGQVKYNKPQYKHCAIFHFENHYTILPNRDTC